MTCEAEGQSTRVVAEAMTRLRTPYHHRGKLKGVGVDCAQLPLVVYAAAGLVEDFDTGDYPFGLLASAPRRRAPCRHGPGR